MLMARRAMLVLVTMAVVLGAWLAPLDRLAEDQVDTGLKRALLSFATARALNAVISVAQGTEVSVQPLGVGVNFAPGQILDPVNDLVEDFSKLMLAASVAFGMQKVLIAIGAYWLLSLLLSIAVLLWTGWRIREGNVPGWLSKGVVILLMLRFAVPAVTLGSDFVFRQFLATDYAASQRIIDTASGQVASLNPPVPTPRQETGVLDKMKVWLAENADLRQRFDSLKAAAEQATDHIIRLIVIFLLQTLVMPLLLLWGLLAAARGVAGLAVSGGRP